MAVWSEVKLKEIEGTFRLDPEYYQPFFLKLLGRLEKRGIRNLDKYAEVKKERFRSQPGNTFDYIEISRVSTSLGTYETIPIEDINAPSRAQFAVRTSDVLLSKVRPNRGAVVLIPERIPRTVSSSGFVVLKPLDLSPEYLFAFLKTDIITKLLDRDTTASMYPAICDDDVLNLPFPEPADIVHDEVTGFVKEAFSRLEQSANLYQDASYIFRRELGFDDLDSSFGLYYETRFSEIREAERFDAEYFQPKYDKARNILTSVQSEPFGSIAVLQKGIQARALENTRGIPYASIKDISGFIIEPTENTDSEKVIIMRPNSLALAITGATIGKVGMNTTEENIAICGDLLSIYPHSLPFAYLQIVMASPMFQSLCEKYTTGATNGHLSQSAVASFPIPILPGTVITEISERVIEAIQNRNESKHLLEEATYLVEKIIIDN